MRRNNIISEQPGVVLAKQFQVCDVKVNLAIKETKY